ncbi:RadC family protein [Paenibacillus sp. MMS18-CY102]|uniref:RadC family protein n=1 Tax=Paenibacillus sp. MMS18-CY102 TaxID=2682849 RepID=UPI001365E109|nr:DNA repair protein RadC [Paenibacillus sp. MMS18-CY102]MWC28746.1 DNA repair protein RadC [Paenibacillus sp. MMS18-CY102]
MELRAQLMRDVPHEERPRERMMAHGAEALSHSELLAILLRTGTSRESVVELASRLLHECGGLRNLVDFSLEQLMELHGVGPAKALQLKAGIELGRRIAASRFGDRPVIKRPQDAAELIMDELRYQSKEHFMCLFLNTKNQVVAKELLSVGTLNASLVHPREVFREAIKRSSASIICAHNHPSGDPTPSPEDITLTKRLSEVGDLIGIEVLDHLIIGDGKFVSLKEHGLL